MYHFRRVNLVASALLIVLTACTGSLSGKLTKTSDESSANSSNRLTTITPSNSWWDQWPRPTGNQNLSTIQALNANVVVAGGGVSDEGIGAYDRENRWLAMKDTIALLKTSGIKYTGWVESQGQCRSIIVAINRKPDGTYTMDPQTGAAQQISTNWSWDFTGPGIDPRANEIVWLGMHSFVNGDSFLGPFTAKNPAYKLPPATYPDGTPATGFLKAGSNDPRDAKFYDGNSSKGLTGVTAITADLNSSKNKTGFLNFDFGPPTGVKPVGDMSPRKDTASPFWIEYAKTIFEFNVTHGGDGMWMDNSTGWDFTTSSPVNNAFGLWSVAKFREYLQKHPEITVPGGASQFDIRDYIRNKFTSLHPGGNPNDLNSFAWFDARFLEDPIWRAYIAFKGETAQKYVRNNYLAIKAAAAAAGKNPDDIYLGGNDIPQITFGALNGDEMDQVNTEYSPEYGLDVESGRGIPPQGHTGPIYATSISLQKSPIAIQWYYLDKPEWKNKPNLGEVLGFEALAHNNILNTDSEWGRSPGTPASMRKVNSTIQQLAPVLGYRLRRGAVAVVFGSYTEATTMTPGGLAGPGAAKSEPSAVSHLDHSLGFAGWIEALEDRHTLYRVIPDYKLPSGIPSDVTVLILPHIRSIDASTIENVLVPFVKRGGAILVSGNDAGAFKTRDYAYASNGRSLLVDLTTRSLSPGQAVFVNGNPGFEFFRGNRENASRKSAAVSQINSLLDAQESAGRLANELDLGSWGQKIWATSYNNASGTKYFIDLVNVNLNVSSDVLTPSPGGKAVFANLPLSGAVAKWYDADGAIRTLDISTEDAAHSSVRIPAFRVYGTLIVEGSPSAPPQPPLGPTPAILNAGTGCADNYCFWVLGKDISAKVAVEVANGAGTVLATYKDSDLTLDLVGQSLTLGLRNPSPERTLLGTQTLQIRLLNQDTGKRSPFFSVSRPGTTPTPPVIPPPQIVNAGAGCADNYCIWIIGADLDDNVSVDVLNQNDELIANYGSPEITYDKLTKVITFALRQGSQERLLFQNQQLKLRLLNKDSGGSSAMKAVKR